MKQIKYWQLCLALWLGISSLSCAQNNEILELAGDEKLIEFTTDRFTLPNLHVTPDGENIIFDVLGDIYQVPIEGGKAEVLLQDNNWKRAGKLSPDGQTLAYVSDETGEFQIWTMDLETQKKRVYLIKESLHYPLYSYWKNKECLLIPSKNGLLSFDVTSGKRQVIRPALEDEKSLTHVVNKAMSVSKSGELAFFQKNGVLWGYDIEKNIDLFIKPIPDKAFLEFVKGSESGEKVVFYKQQKEDKSKQDLISWDLTTNNLKILNTTETLGFSTSLNYCFDFIDNKTIILDKEGEIVRMDIETGEYEPIPIEVDVKKVIKKPLRREPQYIRDSIITASVLRNPVTRPNLDTIYFGAFGKLHSYAKNTEVITEVYPEADRFEISPSLSPDGKYLAFTTWNDTQMGHVYAREVESGKEYQLTRAAGRYINPAWSPDGTQIVFIADETEAKMGIPRQSGGMNTNNYHLDIHRIRFSENNKVREKSKSDAIYRVYPFSIIPRRFYPVPVFHQNGESVLITTRNHEKDLPVLIEVDLETKEIVQERLIPFHTDEVLVSPDAEHIAFVYDEQVWVDDYPHALKIEHSKNSEFIPAQFHYKGGYINNILLSEAKSVYEIAPSYLYWQDEYTLMWGSAQEVYSHDVRTGVTEKIADIKVQKSRAVPKTQYALTNAQIITMNKQDDIIEKGTILVKDNRIEEVGKVEEIVIPENYKVINLEGKTIMPGLIDVHAHYHLFPYEILSQENYAYKGNLAYGVTTIYDPSVNVLDYREQAQMVEAGQLLGPRVFASGNIIMNGTNQYDFKKINSINDAIRVIKSLKKISVSGPIKEYDLSNSMKRKVLRKSSLNNEIGITSHQIKFLCTMNRIVSGYTAIEHEIGSFPLQNDVIQIIAKSGVNYTPTFMVSPGFGDLFLEKTINQNNKLRKLNSELIYHNNYAKYLFNLNSASIKKKNKYFENINNQLEKSSENLKNIKDANGIISVGGHGNPLPGIGTHWELWALTYHKALNNYEALKAATIHGAQKLELHEEIGSLEKGKLADIVILYANPLESIYNTICIENVIINGELDRYKCLKNE